MSQYTLTHDIYTSNGIEAGIAAFAHLCHAASQHSDSHSILTITDCDEAMRAELLNYILTLSAQELLT